MSGAAVNAALHSRQIGNPVKVKLTASKNFTYGRLRLRGGQEFSATRADARILLALAYARHASQRPDEPFVPAAEPPEFRRVDAVPAAEVPQPISAKALEVLRAKFLALAGSAPDRRWGAGRLTAEISRLEIMAADDGAQALEI
jgi:hypothetical protein